MGLVCITWYHVEPLFPVAVLILTMSCIHYKFKSSLDYDTITFEDLHVSLKELRDAICKAKKIGQSNDFKLEIVNAQTKKSKYIVFDLVLCKVCFN